MTSEHVSGISVNYDENTWERQSTCYETVLRFHIWLKELSSDSICLVPIENPDESATVLIWVVFVTRKQVDSPKVF